MTAGFVRRKRLHDLVDESVNGPLTLVIAPAGSGKTSLLSSWAAEHGAGTAWLSLDETDQDPVQLWTGIIAALQTSLPGCGEPALALLRRPDARRDVVPVLLDELDGQDHEPATLVIDDVHLVDDTEAGAESLSEFVQGLPAWLHVVLSSRRDAHLPVDRLRGRGYLREVHFAELRFSRQEADDMLSKIAPDMPADQAATVSRRADGWAASLRLAALAWREGAAQPGHPVGKPEDFRMHEDYLWHELLDGEDPEMVETMLAVSIVERVNSSLAIALTGRDDAVEILARAEAHGQFVNRLSSPGWYTLHELVRELLIAELESRSTEHLRQLHGRAAAWFEAQQQIPVALTHWLQAEQPAEALRLISDQNTALYDSGLESVIVRTLAQVPIRVASRDVASMTRYAWCHLLVDRQRFLILVDQLNRWAQEITDPTDISEVERARIQILASIAATLRGDWDRGGDEARHALAEMGPNWLQDGLSRFGWNMVARQIALSERWDDSLAEVRNMMQLLSLDPERRISFEGTRALGEALSGHPLDALRVSAGVRRVAESTNMTLLRSELAIADAVASRELGDRPRALKLLNELNESAAGAADYTKLLAKIELTLATLDVGDLDGARSLFDEAEDFMHSGLDGPGTQDWLARAGNVLALAAGDTDQAKAWSERIHDPFWSGLSTARNLLASDDRSSATALLEELSPRCVRHSVLRDLLLARATRSADSSLKHVITAIELATENGLLQTIASEGSETVALIEHAAWRAPQHWLDRLRRAATPDLDQRDRDIPDLIESLTDRERQVLRLLPSRLTLREIADELYISVNTLKFHLKVIYRKLGCGSRAEAAELARSLGRIKWSGQSPRIRRL
ncbi:MAG TPA: LuxR C-terminal-related transcriptional regulator [Microlunatus sp.]